MYHAQKRDSDAEHICRVKMALGSCVGGINFAGPANIRKAHEELMTQVRTIAIHTNLPFLSKVVEKSVLLRFNRHCNENNLLPSYQSAYRANFSCETALLKLTDDLLWAMEHQEVTPLVAIDLSATFDTVDHNLLLSILSKKFRVVDKALKWFDSYLRPRRFQVLIDDTRSKEIELPFSVPQGSCAGPVLYSAYTSTLQEVINDQDESPIINKPIELHGFADDHAYKKPFVAKS